MITAIIRSFAILLLVVGGLGFLILAFQRSLAEGFAVCLGVGFITFVVSLFVEGIDP
jgi:hypothetical protein